MLANSNALHWESRPVESPSSCNTDAYELGCNGDERKCPFFLMLPPAIGVELCPTLRFLLRTNDNYCMSYRFVLGE